MSFMKSFQELVRHLVSEYSLCIVHVLKMFLYEKHSFLLLTGLFSCACVSDILIPATTSPKENLLLKIVSDFALKFIQNQATFITLMAASSTPEHDLMHEDIIRNFIKLNDDKFTYLIINYKIRVMKRSTFHLFLIETYKDFSKVLLSINRSSLRAKPRDFFLVVITSVHDNTEEFLNDLFEASYAKSILTINFLSPFKNESAWLMTTFMPFVKSCNSLQQHDIAMLTEQNYSLSGSIDVIYPHKMQDFRQCPIIAAVFHTPPFIIVHSNGSDETVDGIDTRILGQMAQKFNFKLVYRTPPDKRGRGTIYANGSVTGCIKMIVDQEANLTVGAYMRTPSRSHYMVPSESYIQVTLGFAVLPSEDISTPMERILSPFTTHLWDCTGLFVTLAVIIILITKTMTRHWRHFAIGGHVNRAPILNMWNSFLGGSIGNPMFATARYLSTFARTLLVVWSTGCLVLRGSYQGALYDFMQREDLSSPLDTISKINNSDCDLIVMSTATSSLDEFYFDRSRHLTYNYSQQRIFQQVFDRELAGAVYCNDLQMKYFNLLNVPLRRLQMTKDRLFLMSVVIYFNHVSALQPIFDQELLLLTDAGLIQYWAQKFTDGRLDSKSHRQRIPKKLNIQNVLAIFEICSGLLAICFFVFVLEKIGTRFMWLRNIIENLTY